MIENFRSRLRVGQAGGLYSQVISIAFTSPSPVKAANVANRFATLYVERQLEEKRVATSKANEWLTDQLRDMQKEVQEAEERAAKFRAEHFLTQIRGSVLGEEQLAELNWKRSKCIRRWRLRKLSCGQSTRSEPRRKI